MKLVRINVDIRNCTYTEFFSKSCSLSMQSTFLDFFPFIFSLVDFLELKKNMMHYENVQHMYIGAKTNVMKIKVFVQLYTL